MPVYQCDEQYLAAGEVSVRTQTRGIPNVRQRSGNLEITY